MHFLYKYHEHRLKYSVQLGGSLSPLPIPVSRLVDCFLVGAVLSHKKSQYEVRSIAHSWQKVSQTGNVGENRAFS